MRCRFERASTRSDLGSGSGHHHSLPVSQALDLLGGMAGWLEEGLTGGTVLLRQVGVMLLRYMASRVLASWPACMWAPFLFTRVSRAVGDPVGRIWEQAFVLGRICTPCSRLAFCVPRPVSRSPFPVFFLLRFHFGWGRGTSCVSHFLSTSTPILFSNVSAITIEMLTDSFFSVLPPRSPRSRRDQGSTIQRTRSTTTRGRTRGRRRSTAAGRGARTTSTASTSAGCSCSSRSSRRRCTRSTRARSTSGRSARRWLRTPPAGGCSNSWRITTTRSWCVRRWLGWDGSHRLG